MMIYSGSTPINLDNPSDLPFSFSAHVLPPLHRLPPRPQSQEKSSHWKEKHRSIPRSLFRPILRRWEEQSVGVRHLLGRTRQCHLFGGFYLSFSCVISRSSLMRLFYLLLLLGGGNRSAREILAHPSRICGRWSGNSQADVHREKVGFTSPFLPFCIFSGPMSDHCLALSTHSHAHALET